MNEQQILKMSLSKFTDGAKLNGKDFSVECKKNGLDRLINNNSRLKKIRRNFLLKNCKSLGRVSYIKKPIKKTVTAQKEIDFNIIETQINEAIILLKQNGYKIQKAVTKYEDL